MHKLMFPIALATLLACEKPETAIAQEAKPEKQAASHPYGGWYCPDNLNGFPAVNLADWKNVPVIQDRLPTKEETRSSASLIYIDPKEYPNARVLDINVPQLATYYSNYTNREELVIVIQAIEVEGDSVVGFRYINGGNGSARLNQVQLISEKEAKEYQNREFVAIDLKINADANRVNLVMTSDLFTGPLQPVIDPSSAFPAGWKTATNVNFHYPPAGKPTSSYHDKLYGSWYTQNDFLHGEMPYTEKFLLLENQEEGYTTLKVMCGPFGPDLPAQQEIIAKWAQKVKQLAESDEIR